MIPHKIPDSFKLFGIQYKVVKVDRIDSDDNLGESRYTEAQVVLATKDYKGRKISNECMWQTFVHELVHLILGMTAYHEENGNEKLVEAIALGLISYEKQ